jgi:hypothetical protein
MMRSVLAFLALVALSLDAHADTTPPPDSGATAPAPAEPPRYKNVRPHFLDENKLSGEDPHLPYAYKVKMMKAGVREAVGMYKVCVDIGGRVAELGVLGPLGSGADEGVQATLRTWTFRPGPFAWCTLLRLVFHLSPVR